MRQGVTAGAPGPIPWFRVVFSGSITGGALQGASIEGDGFLHIADPRPDGFRSPDLTFTATVTSLDGTTRTVMGQARLLAPPTCSRSGNQITCEDMQMEMRVNVNSH